MSTATSIFISRIRGLPVVDSAGDQVGKLRDVVIQLRVGGRAPRARGLVVELFARRRIFIPMVRVHHIDSAQVAISGVVNTRRFSSQEAETLVTEDLFDRQVTKRGAAISSVIYDVSMKQVRSRDWEVDEVALRDATRSRFGRKPHITIVDWSEIADFALFNEQSTEKLLAELDDMKAPDIARELHDMSPERRKEVIEALDDETLADAIEELPEDEQVELISSLDTERAADILDAMDPDDAADLIAELPLELAERLLGEMEPDEAKDIRRLLTYEESTAGGIMTPEPVILPPDATVADALAVVRHVDITPALASMVFVCRPPLDTPTGRFVGGVHLQRLLREPPSTLISGLIDHEIEPLRVEDKLAVLSRRFATYDMVCAAVVDKDNHLIGAITVDDVLDHLLPDDWRGNELDGREPAAEPGRAQPNPAENSPTQTNPDQTRR